MKTYDEIVDNVIEATAVHRRRVKRAQRIAATSAMCLACVFGLSVYLNLEPQNTLPEFSETETQTTMQTEAGTGAQTESVETTASGTAQATGTDLPDPIESQVTGVQSSVTNAESGGTAFSGETFAESLNSSVETATYVTENDPPPVEETTEGFVDTQETGRTTKDKPETTRSSSVATVQSSTTKVTLPIPDIQNPDPTGDSAEMPPNEGGDTTPPVFTTDEDTTTTTTTTTSAAVLANSVGTVITEVLAKDVFHFVGSYEKGNWLTWIDLELKVTTPETIPAETKTKAFLTQ